jgi:TolB protein
MARHRIHYPGAIALVVMVGVAAASGASAPATGSRLAAGSAQASARIAFVSTPRGGGPAGIYVMNADGGGRRTVTTYDGWGADLAWSPDAQRLAFTRGYPASADIYVVKTDGSGERRLTRDAALDLSPTWSPDGRKIAFVRRRVGSTRIDLYVMNAEGSSERRLRRNLAGVPPVWSPDGRRLAFVGSRFASVDPNGLVSDIYVMNADGSGLRNLTQTPAWEDSIAWSPDGRRIAIVKHTGCLRCSPNSELWVMNADGRAKRVVAFGEGIGVATWSPDGRTLVYESAYRPNPDSPRLRFWYVTELFRVNADGSGQRRLTDGAQPLWSPDGKKIAFVGRRGGKADLYVMNADGSGQRPLTRTPDFGERIFAWSPARTK